MTFDELIDIRPQVRLADVIQLFLLGYDDKIYIDIYKPGSTDELLFEHVRIIDSELVPYYDKYIEYLEEGEPGMSHLSIKLKED